MRNDKIVLTGCCYVMHQGFYNDILKHKEDVILWPENRHTSLERRAGVLYVKSIITESAQFISLYDRNNVFIYREGKWINPERQTYGTSYEIIESDLLFFENSIPMNIISNELLPKIKEKLTKLYSE